MGPTGEWSCGDLSTAIYVVLSDLTENLRKKGLSWTRLEDHPMLHRGLGIAFTFFLFWFTLIIFRTQNLTDALYVMTHLGDWSGRSRGFYASVESLYTVLPKYELITVLIAIGWMIFVEILEKQEGMRHLFIKKTDLGSMVHLLCLYPVSYLFR